MSSSLALFSCRFGILYAEPAARVHSLKVDVSCYVCMQMFSQAYCIYERSAREKVIKKKKSHSLRTMSAHLSQTLRACVVCVCLYVRALKRMCTITYRNHRAQRCHVELVMDRRRKWIEEWMLKAKMVQKACGDWSLDKPRWEEWWTVAQTSAAFIPIFLYDLSNICFWFSFFFFFLHTTKINKAINLSTKKS